MAGPLLCSCTLLQATQQFCCLPMQRSATSSKFIATTSILLCGFSPRALTLSCLVVAMLLLPALGVTASARLALPSGWPSRKGLKSDVDPWGNEGSDCYGTTAI